MIYEEYGSYIQIEGHKANKGHLKECPQYSSITSHPFYVYGPALALKHALYWSWGEKYQKCLLPPSESAIADSVLLSFLFFQVILWPLQWIFDRANKVFFLSEFLLLNIQVAEN